MNSILKFIQLPTIHDDCSLAVAENSKLPFAVKRVYYIYDTVPGEARGHHAHHQTQQILFCLRGSVRMVLETNAGRAECTLTDPSQGIFLDKMVWHEMHDMDEETILLVLASHEYEEKDYVRTYEEFKKLLL